MICPVCHSSGAVALRDFTGRYIWCDVCERKVLQETWTCPTCASQEGSFRIRSGDIEMECKHCHTKDLYLRKPKVVST